MKARTTAKTTVSHFFQCPECGNPGFDYGHLIGKNVDFGPWYCDECGCGIIGTIDKDGVIDIEAHTDRKAKTLVLLRLECSQSDAPIHIIVEGMVFYKPGTIPVIDIDKEKHFYDEYTRPWNYLRIPIKQGSYVDPHGVFVHQETVLMPEGFDIENDLDDSIDQWREIFKSLG